MIVACTTAPSCQWAWLTFGLWLETPGDDDEKRQAYFSIVAEDEGIQR